MPTGSWFSEPYSDRSGGSLTGTGAPSNPRAASWLDTTSGSTTMTNAGPRYNPTAGGSGYTTQSSGGTQLGYNQFPLGQGPSQYMPGSIAQYPDSVYSPWSPTNLAGQLANTMYGPQGILLDQQLARQWDQLGMIGQNADYQRGALTRDNALANQLLGLDRQSLGIDSGLTKTQLANLDRLRGILGQQRVLAGDIASTNTAEAKDQASRKTFDLRSALTARGAFNTVANERGTGRINRDLMYQLAGIEQQFRGTRMGLDEKGIGYDNQQAQLQAKLGNIGLDYQRLGINEQQLANSLQDGLQQIGLSSQVSINSLLDAMGGTNLQQAQLAQTILGEVMNLSNLSPEVAKQLAAALGITGATGSTMTSTPTKTYSGGGGVRVQ